MTDPRIKELTFTGTIFRDHIDEWTATLPGAFPVITTTAPNGTIALTLRPDFH